SYLTGLGNNSLYFAVPLRGDFELRCQRTAGTWRGLLPQYAGVAFDFDLQKQVSIRHAVGRAGAAGVPLAKPLKVAGPIDFRLVARAEMVKQFANGGEVPSERLDATANPWLTFAPRPPGASDPIRQVQILGNPETPRKIKLSAENDLAGWSAQYYPEP